MAPSKRRINAVPHPAPQPSTWQYREHPPLNKAEQPQDETVAQPPEPFDRVAHGRASQDRPRRVGRRVRAAGDQTEGDAGLLA